MGYGYGRTASGRMALACDNCGAVGGVRKRTCPHMVHYVDMADLPYCQPPAYCGPCWQKAGGNRIHDTCKAGAAKSNERESEHGRRLAAGELEVLTAWGDWHPAVPPGQVGVRFGGLGARTGHGPIEFRLIPKADYDHRTKHYLGDFPVATPWIDPDMIRPELLEGTA